MPCSTLSQHLGVLAVMGTGKYFGLPSMVGRSREATFGFIKDIIMHMINF